MLPVAGVKRRPFKSIKNIEILAIRGVNLETKIPAPVIIIEHLQTKETLIDINFMMMTIIIPQV